MQPYQHMAKHEDHRRVLERADEIAVRKHRAQHDDRRVSVSLVHDGETMHHPAWLGDTLQFQCGECGEHVSVTRKEAE